MMMRVSLGFAYRLLFIQSLLLQDPHLLSLHFLMWRSNFAEPLQSIVFLLFLAVIWALELVFLDVLENILEFDTAYFSSLAFYGLLLRMLICHSQLLSRQLFDHRILFRNDKLICLDGISLRKVHDFSLQTIDGESLGCGDFQDSFNMHNNFVEIGVLLLKLLESLLLINL